MAKKVWLPDDTFILAPDNVTDDQALMWARQNVPNAFPEVKPPTPVAPEATPERSWGEAATDIGAGALKGLGSLVQMPGQLTGLVTGDMEPGMVGKAGKSIEEYGQGLKSKSLLAQEEAQQKALKEAYEQGGFFGEAGAALKTTLTSPALLGSFLAEQVPMLFGSAGVGLAAKIGTRAALTIGEDAAKAVTAQAAKTAAKVGVATDVATNAVMQAADVAGDTYEQVLQRLNEKNPDLAPAHKHELALSAARKAAVEAVTISGATSFLPGSQSLERALLGRELGQVGAKEGAEAATKGALSRGLEGFAGEGLQEAIEEGPGGQLLTNIGLQGVDPSQQLLQGVGGAATMGGIAGGIFGGAANVLNRPAPPKPKIDEYLNSLAEHAENHQIPTKEWEGIYHDAAQRAADTAEPGEKLTVYSPHGDAFDATVVGRDNRNVPIVGIRNAEGRLEQHTLGTEFTLINPLDRGARLVDNVAVHGLSDEQLSDLIEQVTGLVEANEQEIAQGVVDPDHAMAQRELTMLVAEEARRKIAGSVRQAVKEEPEEKEPTFTEPPEPFELPVARGYKQAILDLYQPTPEPLSKQQYVAHAQALADKGVLSPEYLDFYKQKMKGVKTGTPELYRDWLAETLTAQRNQIAPEEIKHTEPPKVAPVAEVPKVEVPKVETPTAETPAVEVHDLNATAKPPETAAPAVEKTNFELAQEQQAQIHADSNSTLADKMLADAKVLAANTDQGSAQVVRDFVNRLVKKGALTQEEVAPIRQRLNIVAKNERVADGGKGDVSPLNDHWTDVVAENILPVLEGKTKQPVAEEQKPAAQKPATKHDEPLPEFEEEEEVEQPNLPKDLAGGKANYKTFGVEFANDIDKASYFIADPEKKSKRDEDYLNFVMQNTGWNEEQARAHGQQVRDEIKENEDLAHNDVINLEEVERHANPHDRALGRLENLKNDSDVTKGKIKAFGQKLVKQGVLPEGAVSYFDSYMKDPDMGPDDLADALQSEIENAQDSAAKQSTAPRAKLYKQNTHAANVAKQVHARKQQEWMNKARPRVVDLMQKRMDRLGLGKYIKKDVLTSIKNGGVNGQYFDKIIQLAISGKSDEQIASTLDHEAIHAMKEIGMITDQEWANLKKAVDAKGWMDTFFINQRYPNLNEEEQYEEVIADAFATYVNGRSPILGYNTLNAPVYAYKKDMGMVGQPVGILKRIMNMLRGIRAAVSESELAEEAFKRFQETPMAPAAGTKEVKQKKASAAPKFGIGQIPPSEIEEVKPSTEEENETYVYRGKLPDTFWDWFGDSVLRDEQGRPRIFFHGTARKIDEFKPKQANAIFATPDRLLAYAFADTSLDWVAKNLDQVLSEKQFKAADKIMRKRAREIGIPANEWNTLPAAEIIDNVEELLPDGKDVLPLFVKAENPFDYSNESHIKALQAKLKEKNITQLEGFKPRRPGIKRDVLDEVSVGNWNFIELPVVQEIIRAMGHDGFYVMEDGVKNIAVYDPNQVKSATENAGTYSKQSPDIRKSIAPKLEISGTAKPVEIYKKATPVAVKPFVPKPVLVKPKKYIPKKYVSQIDFATAIDIANVKQAVPVLVKDISLKPNTIKAKAKPISNSKLAAKAQTEFFAAEHEKQIKKFNAENAKAAKYEYQQKEINLFGPGILDPEKIVFHEETNDFAYQGNLPDEFWEWFGNSVIKDKDGYPLIYFHGTARQIDVFQPKQANAIFATPQTEFASMFAEMSENWVVINLDKILSKEDYDSWLKEVETESLKESGDKNDWKTDWSFEKQKKFAKKYFPVKRSIMPLFVRAENPFDFRNFEDVEKVAEQAIKNGFENVEKINLMKGLITGDWKLIERPEIQKVIKDFGFDSFFVKENTKSSLVNVAVYDPNQVKSATENAGTYSRQSPDIRKSIAPRLTVSTARPTGKKPIPGEVAVRDPIAQTLIITGKNIREMPEHLDAAVRALKEYNTFPTSDNPDKLLENLHNTVVDNLIWLYDLVPQGVRDRAKLWYDGANRIAREMASKFGYTESQIAGVYAVLSPQKDWFMNVSLGDRIISIFHGHQNDPWTSAMSNWVRSYVNAAATVDDKNKRREFAEKALKLQGRRLKDLTNKEAALYIRVFDETYYPRTYRVVTPEGGFLGYVEVGDDKIDDDDVDREDHVKRGHVAWGGYNTIEKAVSILRDGSFKNISDSLGDEHKVRNFYNNIIEPGSAEGHVTIDTHAIAAALFKALSGSSVEVIQNFGGAGAGGSKATGASGTYGFFADAYRDAAAQVAERDKISLLPREMQSITWEAIRSIFPAAWKRENMSKVEGVYNRYKKGEISRVEARDEIIKMSPGLTPFAWEGETTGHFVQDGGFSFDSNISDDLLSRKARTLEPKVARDKINVNIAATTESIPGLMKLHQLANEGSFAARRLLQDVAIDNMQHLMSGLDGIKIKYIPAVGLYDRSIEPSIALQVSFPEHSQQNALAAIRKFAENFNQQQFHVRKLVAKATPLFQTYPDGSFITPGYRWELNRALTQDEIQSLIDSSGLAGLTFGDDFIEAYFVGNPKDITNVEQTTAFIEAAKRVTAGLGDRASGLSESRSRLWAYGDDRPGRDRGWGATTGYSYIQGDIPKGKNVTNKTVERVAEYLQNEARERASPEERARIRNLKPFRQAKTINKKQQRLQERIAEFQELLPDNDLRNPLVKKAYKALAEEVFRQYLALPIRLEILGERDKDGNLVDKYKNKSDAMRQDIADNNHLYIYPTTPETFGPPGSDFSKHPLLADSGLKDINGAPLLYNDLLRAVHDYFAHAIRPITFGPLGEEAAWKNHMAMTSNPFARWALTMETRAQNSWVNFRKGIDKSIPLSDRPFSAQKASLLPLKFILTGDPEVDEVMRPLFEELTPEQQLGSSSRKKKAYAEALAHLAQDEQKNAYPYPLELKTEAKTSSAPKLSATALYGGHAIPTTWQTEAPTRMDTVIRTMQNRFVDLDKVMKSINQAIGRISDDQNVSLKEELYHQRVADQVKQFNIRELRPLLAEMKQRNVSFDELQTFLHNRHAEERNDQIQSAGGMVDGSGIKTADARRYLSGLSASERNKLNAVSAHIDRINKKTRQMMVQYGLKDQATINLWESIYPTYVPLQRELEDWGNEGTGMGQGMSVTHNVKRAMGSHLNVESIVANVAALREQTIVKGEKNRVGQSVFGLALKAPKPDFWIAVDPDGPRNITRNLTDLYNLGFSHADAMNIAKEPVERFINAQGMIDQRVNPRLRNADNVLHLMINGKEKLVIFSKKDKTAEHVVKALKNIEMQSLNKAMLLTSAITRWFAAINTQYNPVFGVINLLRDTGTAMLTLTDTPLAGKQAKVLSHVMPAMKGIWDVIRAERSGGNATSSWSREYEQFARLGGPTGFLQRYENTEERAKEIAKEFKQLSQGAVPEGLRYMRDMLSDYNTVLENAVRLSAFKEAKAQGMSPDQAASVAKNLTVNFNRKGDIAMQMGSLYAFFNASVQGSARVIKTMTGPAGKKIMAGGILLGVVQAIALSAAGFDEDEPPEFIKEKNLLIPTGDGKYISIPLPLGFNVLPNIGRTVTDLVMHGGKDAPKKIASLLASTANAFNPLGETTALQTFAPTFLDPAVGLAENKDWSGRRIAKEDMTGLRPTPGFTRSKESATPWSQSIAKFLNFASGGTYGTKGVISPTADQIDYLIGQATGGVGREIGKLGSIASTASKGEELPTHKIPLVGRFIGNTKESAAVSSHYYENLTKMNEHAMELKDLRMHPDHGSVADYFKENPDARLVPMSNSVNGIINGLNQQKKLALDRGMPEERVKQINNQIQVQMKRLNDRIKEIRV